MKFKHISAWNRRMRWILFLGIALACWITACGPEPAGRVIIDEDSPPAAPCIVPPEEYHWQFQEISNETRERGTKCTAELVFENTSDQAQRWFYLLESSDGKNQSKKWVSISLQPSDKIIKNISHTKYKNEGVTYQRITRLLVCYDEPDCKFLLEKIQKGLEFDENSTNPIENPCPIPDQEDNQ